MSLRPLVSVFGLTVGDYLLWSWSLNHNHDVLALISGLTLPPLLLACLWLLVLNGMRLLTGMRPLENRRRGAQPAQPAPARHTAVDAGSLEEAPAPVAAAGRSSGKLAA